MNWSPVTNQAVTTFILNHQEIFGVNGLDSVDLTDRVVLKREYGFAVIRPHNPKQTPHIDYLWINPEFRGHGVGRKFVSEIKRLYGQDYLISLYCYGAERRAFFGRCGFKVESRDLTTGLRIMVG